GLNARKRRLCSTKLNTMTQMANWKWTPDNIRALRSRMGWTQQQLGEWLGYEKHPIQRISEYETGRKVPSGRVQKLLDLIEKDQIKERKCHPTGYIEIYAQKSYITFAFRKPASPFIAAT